jgi:hypothetical protein
MPTRYFHSYETCSTSLSSLYLVLSSILTSPSSSPVLEHLHYVSPQTLPKLYIGSGNTAAQWTHDCTSVTASTWEYSSLKHVVASGTDLPGRLGVKCSIACMYTHIFGFRRSERVLNFSLHTPSGEIAKIFVDAVRMDVSNQTVFINAAIIPCYSETSTDIYKIVLCTMCDQKIVPLEIEPRRFDSGFISYLRSLSAVVSGLTNRRASTKPREQASLFPPSPTKNSCVLAAWASSPTTT